jgi:hypothetical protein
MTRRRSERVLLQIRVIVETTTDEGRWVRLDAFTLVVNAHGGLLELALKLAKGQKMVLMNPVLGVQEPCRVVDTRRSQDAHFTVAFEFDSPAPQFWPISFPPANWSLAQTES